ncbi:phasin family protein [Sedimentitalea todarodis]|uniref:Phasin family protein n=1 Tax=Sedimentitalea todarodis TaxID=1631240 RepID=A0ABU3VH50_9RHOB|nr:phasin family protein [Sedimentitalea todarodis]MDU9005009.1 phasin family protein [Sedimentitalea todarodis]
MPRTRAKDQKAATSTMEMTQALLQANPKVMEAWLDLMNESARFVADRLQKDQETQKALLSCNTPAELMQVQSEFLSNAVSQYTAQTTRVFEKMSEATRVTLTETAKVSSRGYDDVPL